MGNIGAGETNTLSTYRPSTFLVQYYKQDKWNTFGEPYPDYVEALDQMTYLETRTRVSGSVVFGATEFRLLRQEVITKRKVQDDGEHRPSPRTQEEATDQTNQDESAS